MPEQIISIDPGPKNFGVVVLVDRKIEFGHNFEVEEFFTFLDKQTLWNHDTNNITLVYEDVRPYASRFNMDTINTCKVIGRLEYVLNQRKISFKGIARNEVKAYVFNHYYSLIVKEVEARIHRLKKVRKDGKEYKPSFQYVNDRMVVKAMKEFWGIKKPKPGHKNELGVRTHAWQALGAATCYLSKLEEAASGIF